MAFLTCKLEGLIIVEPDIFEDNRGYFFEAYNQQLFQQNGITRQFVQDNRSCWEYYYLPKTGEAHLYQRLQAIRYIDEIHDGY